MFNVLLDPWAYPLWVIGARRIRGVDASWPSPGSRFHHTVGAGPAAVDDSSRVLELDVPHRIELEVRFRPVGVGIVLICVGRAPGGSLVTMSEAPRQGPFDWLWGRALGALVRWRNERSLRQLADLVEARDRWDAARSAGGIGHGASG